MVCLDWLVIEWCGRKLSGQHEVMVYDNDLSVHVCVSERLYR